MVWNVRRLKNFRRTFCWLTLDRSCGSDLHEYLGGPSLCPEETPHPITGEKVPLTFGHEFSGVVVEVGEGVSDRFKVGSRVVVAPIIFDGDCGACQEGLVNCCWQNGFVGLSGWGGELNDERCQGCSPH